MSLEPYQEKTIRELRHEYPVLAPFLDREIAEAYSTYSHLFYSAGWIGNIDKAAFVHWATTAPLDAIRSAGGE